MSIGDKFLNRRFNKPNFETQVSNIVEKISKTKEESTSVETLFIDSKEDKTQETKQIKKQKTATDIHLEIKQTLDDSPDLSGHEKARSVLKQAFSDGFKGKRLTRWQTYIGEYFSELEKTVIVESDMGSSLKTIRVRKPMKESEEKILPGTTNESTITQPKEKEVMSIDIPDLPFDELEAAEEGEIEDTSLQDESGGAITWGVIGAGQAGGRLAESFYRLGYKKCLAVNTAEHDLDGLDVLPEAQKVVMDAGSGGGAGKDMTRGQAATVKHQQEIYEKLQKLFGPVDRILVCAGGGGGCVSSETKVLTDRFGLISVKDLWKKVISDSDRPLKVFNENTQDAQLILKGRDYTLKVASSDENGNVEFKLVDCLWNNSDKGLAYSVETNKGCITTSAKHPFFIYDSKSNKLIEKKASEIQEEDLLFAYGHGFDHSYQIDKDYCWLLGYFAGDGNFKESYTTRFSDANIQNLRKAERICKRLGVSSTNLTKDPRQNSYELYVYGKEIQERLRKDLNIRDNDKKTGNLSVPKDLLTTNKESFVAFLAGVLDSDGHVKTRRNSFEILMTDISFVKQLCESARLHNINCTFKIKSSVRENEKVLGRALFQHVNLSGYQGVLKEHLEGKKEKFVDVVSIGSIFPINFEEIKEHIDSAALKDRYFYDYTHNKYKLSFSKAEVFFREYGNGALKECWQYLVPVSSVTTEENVDYYDLTVSENASYFAGNEQLYLVHNTGGGACLTLVETAKKYLTYLGVENPESKVGVLLTLPRKGESASPGTAKNAHDIASTLCEYAADGELSPLVIFDNDKIDRLYPKLSPRRYWSTVNATVTGLFHMFNVLASKPGLESFDTADYGRVLSAGGCVIMGMTNVKEFSDGTHISQAIRQNLEKGLLCGGFDISTAKAAASLATASGDILDTSGLMQSLQQGFDTLANLTGNAQVFPGIYEVDKDKLVVYTMLTGLDAPQKRLDDLFRFHQK